MAAYGPDPVWVLVLFLGLAGLALVAYALRALDLGGAVASFALGLFVALRGGLGWLALLVLFTAIGFLVTRVGAPQKKERRIAEQNDGERGMKNVLANGAAAGLAALALYVAPPEAAALAFAAAVAAVTADTSASELGGLAPRARRILPPFEVLEPGRNGGVSWPGQAAALAGAALIGVAAVPLLGLAWGWAWIPALAGFTGCQLDSVLGASLERDELHDRPLSKEDVNFIASFLPALVVLVAVALLV